MKTQELFSLAESFEDYLGDPGSPRGRISFEAVLDHDEREAYPFTLVDPLCGWGIHDYFVPGEFGGKAVNIHEGFFLYRSVTRRDPTTATCMMISSVGFMPVWVGGSPEQKDYFSQLLRRGAVISWGLTERSHGSDILANELRAERVEGGYRLTGEKWLVGNATVGDAVTVFARTGKANTPAGFSIFVVEKSKLPRQAYSHLPGERCHGLRALDLSGIRFHDAFVEERARIGREGQGLEIALKASQLIRVMINTISLGCVDTALRITYGFAREREIFGQRVSDIPYSATQLAESFCDLLIADTMATAAVRSLQSSPEQASVTSSTVKYFIPTLLERTMDTLRVVLGARFYLRRDPRYGMFQKLLRDITVAGLADGNTIVNLKNLIHQVEPILHSLETVKPEVHAQAAQRVRRIFDLDADLGPYRPQAHDLNSRGLDDIVLALPESLAELRKRAGSLPPAQAERLLARAEAFLGFGRELRRSALALKDRLGRAYGQSAELCELAKHFCALYAAACCIHRYVNAPVSHTPELRDADWLLCCLDRLWGLLHPLERGYEPEALAATSRLLQRLFEERRLFSFFDIRLAESSPRKEVP